MEMGLAPTSLPSAMLPRAQCFFCFCHQVLAPSPEPGCKAVASHSGRRGLLWRLRDKQLRLGLFEISPGHELHRLTCMMQAGLWAATQVSMDHPPRVSGQSALCPNGKTGPMPWVATAELGIGKAIRGGNQGLGAGREGQSRLGAEARKPERAGCLGDVRNTLAWLVAV